MSQKAKHLTPSQAARTIGISTKALRLYERHGLIAPDRNAAGWRLYGPYDIARAGRVAELRRLGLGLQQIAQVLEAPPGRQLRLLDAHQDALEHDVRRRSEQIAGVANLRSHLASGGELDNAPKNNRSATETVAAEFALPWPWGGERFELRRPGPLTYIVGPLFSGKTKLARLIAEMLPKARFLGLDRATDCDADPAIEQRVRQTLADLAAHGARPSKALATLLNWLEADGSGVLVIDMIEQGLDSATQSALMAHLRARDSNARSIFMLTRSRVILDLPAIGAGEAIIHCPANHSPPVYVTPVPGAPGYEAVATCLAAPEVRARTAGVIAVRPDAA